MGPTKGVTAEVMNANVTSITFGRVAETQGFGDFTFAEYGKKISLGGRPRITDKEEWRRDENSVGSAQMRQRRV